MDEAIKKLQGEILIGSDFLGFLKNVDEFLRVGQHKLIRHDADIFYAKAFLLKISNFLVGKYQYLNRHDFLISSPYALVVDPSNSCPLHCPGCLHNRVFQEKINPDWSAGTLKQETFDCFIKRYGPYASTVLFYNWGEPLLNKHTPDFIKKAKSYLLNTSLSSNLSVKFDAEELVLSGLDFLTISIDGASEKTYKHYRRGGRFNLVIENVKKIVAAKKKYSLSTPILSWQFLLFEHTKNEMELAKKMADELGVNDVKFSRPYDVIWDDNLTIAKDVTADTYVVGYENGNDSHSSNLVENISKDFENEFAVKWQDKLPDAEKVSFLQRKAKTCQWLYSTLVMDANGRYLPCCYVPRKDSGFTWVFGDSKANDEPFNSEYYRFSRQHFAWLSELKKPGGVTPKLFKQKRAPYCVACPDKNVPPLVNSEHLRRYVKNLDKFKVLSKESLEIIANWDD